MPPSPKPKRTEIPEIEVSSPIHAINSSANRSYNSRIGYYLDPPPRSQVQEWPKSAYPPSYLITIQQPSTNNPFPISGSARAEPHALSLHIATTITPQPSTQTNSIPPPPPFPSLPTNALNPLLNLHHNIHIHSNSHLIPNPNNNLHPNPPPSQPLFLTIPEDRLIPAPFQIGDVVERFDGVDAYVWRFEVREVRVIYREGKEKDVKGRGALKGKMEGKVMVKIRDLVGIEEWVWGGKLVVVEEGREEKEGEE